MYSAARYFQAMQTWQQACLVCGKMVASANQTLWRQSMDTALEAMKPEAALRMMLEGPAAFGKSRRMADRAAARGGHGGTASIPDRSS